MPNIEQLANRVRNLGIIIGVPVIIGAAIYFHNAEISALKEQNELLRQTQYDKALALIEAQKKLGEQERRIVAETLVIINNTMVDVEKFTQFKNGLPEDFSTDTFEENIQEVAQKLNDLHDLIAPTSKGE
jgi:hypothetical protein